MRFASSARATSTVSATAPVACATRCAAAASRSATITRAPSATNLRTMPSPNPEPPPVTMVALPCSRMVCPPGGLREFCAAPRVPAMRVFISHAWEDKPVALELARLPPFVEAWVDVRELLGGQDLDPTIIEAIEDSHIFLTLVSRLSMTKPYVNKELAWALEREAKKDRVFILPVMI